ncbi:MAG TPA: rhomboid-like protein [Mycobacterium sp.]|nr:rhomboid-like protein [Mycobacterium sp.]HUH69185.1 rhomboid-like protein [Mycobacterium sp.]
MTVRRTAGRWTAVAARTLSGAAALRVTTAYAVALVAVSVTLTALGPHARDVAVSRMSTNLHNLARGHLSTLVGSAFVSAGGDLYVWLPGLVCLLALGELIWRSGGLLIAFTVGHIGATLIVAVGLVAAVETGWLPVSVAHATDVGISYGAVCVLGALTASIPWHWRPSWVGWWLGIAVTVAWGADFTAVGHVLALLLGIGLSFRLPSAADWTPIRVVLLSAGVVFGFFVLSGSSVAATVGGLAGLLIALMASWVLQSRNDKGRMSARQPGFALQAAHW